ncbi:MAG: hypothetical protein LBH95_06060 [Oscillospiraceae bacterium]|nr:hypothetical protein [Oscillospiraceae bacterium]
MDITALFDNVDSAEHALVNLQSLGIFPSRYKIRALHIAEDGEHGLFAGGAGAAGSMQNTPGISPLSAAPGFTVASIAGGGADCGGSEPPSREVQLLLTVDGAVAHRARSALISNYARRVRMV